jgi:dipeptidyl aminopeptidase/acylaminoacyl peptidase
MRFIPLLLLSTTLAAQAPKRPMTFADLQAMKRIADPQVSPSGKWVLFSVTESSLEKNAQVNHLWAVPLDGSAKEHQVTFSTGESDGRFAPNGQFVMFTGAPNDTDKVSRIAIAPWDETAGTLGVARTLNAVSTPAAGAIWSPDSNHILFTTAVYPACSDKPTWTEEDACNKAGDEAAAASPVKAQVLDHLLYRHWNAYTGEKRSHIILADFSMDGANPRDLTPRSVIGDAPAPTFSLGGPLGYAWAPDSKEIAYVVNLDKVPAESTNNDIFVLKIDAVPMTATKVSTSPGSDDGPQYSPDGKYLAWRSQARAGFESDKFNLDVMDRATGKVRSLTTAFMNWVDEFTWAPTSMKLYFASARVGEEPIYSIGVDGSALSKIEDPYLNGEFGGLQLDASGRTLVASHMAVDRPSEILTFDNERQQGWTDDPVTPATLKNIQANHAELSAAFYPVKSLVITHLNDGVLSAFQLGSMESFFFLGAGGEHVQGFLIRPPNFDPSKKYPLKFLIHGGPQGAWGDAWSYRWNPELFAANGYVVVMINPRGSTGYGQKFVDEVSGDWGGRPYIDLMKGLDYAEKEFPFIDKARECALGGSYGGFMANYILTHTHRFACIVSHDGMYNPQSAFGTTEELWFPEWEFRPLAKPATKPGAPHLDSEMWVSTDAGDATVEQDKPAHPWDFYNLPASQDPFRKFSPMESIANAKTPTLIIHGQLDYRLDVSEALQLFTALQIRHVPSKMLYFPDEGHWVLKPQNSQLWYQTVNDWVDQWTHTNAYAATAK